MTPEIDSLSFDFTGCELREEGPQVRGWMTEGGAVICLQFTPGPPSWTFDLTDPEAAREFYSLQCGENGGAMLSLDIIDAAGLECLRGLFKYRAPVTGSLAMYYVGILWLPFREGVFQINVESMEHGTTGTREAAVMAIMGDSWARPVREEPPVVVKNAEDLFSRMRRAEIRSLPSDDERYDGMFPDHPLSQVRKRLNQIVATLSLDVPGRAVQPFRVRRGWRLW